MRVPHPVAVLLGTTGLIAMLACGTGTTSSPGGGAPQATTTAGDKTDGVATVKVGETIHVKSFGSEYTVTIANLRTGVKSGNQFTQPKPGNQFIVLDATVAVKSGHVFASPGMFKLVTSQGTVYDWAIVADMKGVDQDWTVTLNAGQNKSGQVVLDVPKELTGAKIYIQELDKPAGYWAL
ncbi:MAG TPA: hypothetical protein DGT23_19545 [Micromonosporaceae bacterium]|nr:hypothetical protein [Micromonosporaceae bacterium]